MGWLKKKIILVDNERYESVKIEKLKTKCFENEKKTTRWKQESMLVRELKEASYMKIDLLREKPSENQY